MAFEDDFQYALSSLRIVHAPKRALETFGTTKIHYHLVSELMDEVDQVRVREGHVYSERPQIITPDPQLLSGFGEKAAAFADEIAARGELVKILKYGLQFRKDPIREHIIHDALANVSDHVCAEAVTNDEDHAAVLVGCDELWEVALIKFAFDYVQSSVKTNLQELHEEETRGDREVEAAFAAARRDPSQIGRLGDLLRQHELFDKYEDRFFSLLRRSG
jgi:hypothetical protein